MKRIKVDFQNCYGIRQLVHEFDTSEGQAFLIYAPNGAMKSSFARVFADVAGGKKPKDSIFPHRQTAFSITDENGSSIAPERVLVVDRYVEGYASEKTATLMVDKELRRQYEDLVKSIEDKAKITLTALGQAAGVKRGVETELASAYGSVEGDIYGLLDRIQNQLKDEADPGVGKIAYAEVFNDKVLAFLAKEDVRRQLADYVDRYNELIAKSTYFRRGVFNHNHAATVRKALADNGFFAAKHTVSLAALDGSKKEITSPKELESAIDEEKKLILNDPVLASKFEAIDREITRNAELRQFRSYLESYPELIPELTDLGALRRKLWLSYSFAVEVQLAEFASTYRAAKQEIARVVETARRQQTAWRKVLSIFHRRFSVPFSLRVVNQDDVMLKNKAPVLIFKYRDGDDERDIDRSELIKALSTGEQRALYLLNVIFEIEARAMESERTILVLDDIADSFDYKNKYAIVEYLKAILDTGKFVMLILTHNFDFYRTVRSRLSVGRKQNCLMATKSDNAIDLTKAANLDPFQHWRKNLHKERKLMVASIPMVRNLVEYQKGEDAAEFIFLTSLLHRKPGSDAITMTQLADVLNGVLGTGAPGGTEMAIDVILQEANGCTADGYTINLENKVVLSMAIRLLAEQFMIEKINDPAETDNIISNQTRKLFDFYRRKFPGDTAGIAVLESVMLMTPETIHLNSFMYEPILDMADGHLKSLHDQLKSLLADHKALQDGRVARVASAQS